MVVVWICEAGGWEYVWRVFHFHPGGRGCLGATTPDAAAAPDTP